MRDPHELISAYFDDSLAEGELAELRAWLAGDPERLRQFARESVIHSRLRDVLVQQDMRGLVFEQAFGDAVDVFGDSVDPQHIASLLDEEQAAAMRRAEEAAEQTRRDALAAERQAELLDRTTLRIDEPRVPRKLVYASMAAAAVLLVMLGRLMGPPEPKRGPASPSLVTRTPAAPPAVAVIGETFNVRLERDGRALRTGDRLPAGKLLVERGVAEVRFVSGASVTVEAPAELDLMTGERARLLAGRAVALVPPEAVGFTMHSANASFVDLGTEFGVEVGRDGEASVHVLDGEVALVSDKNAATPSRTLQRGLASAVDADGAMHDIPFDHTRFLRRVPASAYELAVLKSGPLAYWRLDEFGANAEVMSEGRLALSSFVNAGITAVANRGRGGPLRAAQFTGEHDGIDVTADAALGLVSECTCEAWVLPSDQPTGPQRVFSTFDRPRSGLAIGVVDGDWYQLADDKLKFQLTVYGVYDCISATPIEAGEWVHLTATIDEAGAPALFVNGARVERRFRPLGVLGGQPAPEGEVRVWTDESPTPIGRPTMGTARIGRNPTGSDGQVSPECWSGLISNVAVYDRVLDAKEIHQHFTATRENASGSDAGNP